MNSNCLGFAVFSSETVQLNTALINSVNWYWNLKTAAKPLGSPQCSTNWEGALFDNLSPVWGGWPTWTSHHNVCQTRGFLGHRANWGLNRQMVLHHLTMTNHHFLFYTNLKAPVCLAPPSGRTRYTQQSRFPLTLLALFLLLDCPAAFPVIESTWPVCVWKGHCGDKH